jgi:acetyl esterase/lipase
MVRSKRSHRVKKRFLGAQDFGALELLEKRHALDGSTADLPPGWAQGSVSELEDEVISIVAAPANSDYGGAYQLNLEEDGSFSSFFEAISNWKGSTDGRRIPIPSSLYAQKIVRDDFLFLQAKPKQGITTPVVVYFHGGGFVAGGKNQVVKKFPGPVAGLLRNGISVVSVNYKLIKASELLDDPNSDYAAYRASNFFASGRTEVGQLKGYMRYLNRNAEDPYASEEPFRKLKNHIAPIVSQCNQWINFVESKAQEWNLDVTRIGLAGSSAGALIANWLGHRAVAVAVRDLPVMTEELVTEPLAGFGSLSARSADDLPPLWIRQGEGASNDLHAPENASHLEALYSARSREAVFEKYGSSKNAIPKPLAGQTAVDFFSRYLLSTG